MNVKLIVFRTRQTDLEFTFADAELGSESISEIRFTDIYIHGEDDVIPTHQVRTQGEDSLYEVLHVNTLAVHIEAITSANDWTFVYVRAYGAK